MASHASGFAQQCLSGPPKIPIANNLKTRFSISVSIRTSHLRQLRGVNSVCYSPLFSFVFCLPADGVTCDLFLPFGIDECRDAAVASDGTPRKPPEVAFGLTSLRFGLGGLRMFPRAID
jgi:hypothetical protein